MKVSYPDAAAIKLTLVPAHPFLSTGFVVIAAGVFTERIAKDEIVFVCVHVPFNITLY
jgi:hypothetical protein